MSLAPFFGRDVGISSKVPSIQPPPPAIGLGSQATSFSGSCLPFFPLRASSVTALNKTTVRLKSLWRFGTAQERQPRAWVPRTAVGRQRFWLEENQRNGGRGRFRSKAAEWEVHSGSCSPLGGGLL